MNASIAIVFLGAFAVGQNESTYERTPETIQKGLESKDVKVRRRTAAALDFDPVSEGIPAMVKALQDPDAEVRMKVAHALGKLGRISEYLDKKKRLAKGMNLDERLMPVVPHLVKLLSDKEASVRWAAANALLGFGSMSKEALPALIEAKKDSDRKVQVRAGAAVAVIGDGGDDAIRFLLQFSTDEDEEVSSDSCIVFVDIGVRAIPILKDGLKDKDPNVRSWTLGAIRASTKKISEMAKLPGDVIPPIINLIDDENNEVAGHAIYTLSQLGIKAKGAIPALQKRLSDKDWALRMNAYSLLGSIAGKDAIPALVKGLSDPEERVRGAVVRALGAMVDHPDSVVPVLIEALQYRDREVMSCAIVQLRNFGPAASPAVPFLIKLIRDDDGPGGYIGLGAIEALKSIGPAAKPAIPALIKALRYEGPTSRIRAGQALVAIGLETETVVPALVANLDDQERSVRCQTARSLGSLGASAEKAIPRLTELLNDPDRIVSYEAKEAIKQIRGKKK